MGFTHFFYWNNSLQMVHTNFLTFFCKSIQDEILIKKPKITPRLSNENNNSKLMRLIAAYKSSNMLNWHQFVLGNLQPKSYYRE